MMTICSRSEATRAYCRYPLSAHHVLKVTWLTVAGCAVRAVNADLAGWVVEMACLAGCGACALCAACEQPATAASATMPTPAASWNALFCLMPQRSRASVVARCAKRVRSEEHTSELQ